MGNIFRVQQWAFPSSEWQISGAMLKQEGLLFKCTFLDLINSIAISILLLYLARIKKAS
jgi:hypothetical protein